MPLVVSLHTIAQKVVVIQYGKESRAIKMMKDHTKQNLIWAAAPLWKRSYKRPIAFNLHVDSKF